MQTNRYKDTPINPIELNGVNHADLSLDGKLMVSVQFDPITNSDFHLYWRVDQEPTAGATVAAFKPEQYLVAGQGVDITVDPDGDWYLHVLLVAGDGTVSVGGADDRVLLATWRANP